MRTFFILERERKNERARAPRVDRTSNNLRKCRVVSEVVLGGRGEGASERLIMSYFPRGWRVHYVADLLEKYMTGKSSGGGSLIRQFG